MTPITITDLIMNFREALLGIVPCFERIEMPWRSPDAYDEWDNCATALFEALVVEPLRYSLPETEQEGFRLPPYDLLLHSYADMRVIEIMPANPDGTMRVFHALGTALSPFDVVKVRTVGQDGLPKSEEALETFPIESARFAIRASGSDSAAHFVEDIAELWRRRTSAGSGPSNDRR